MSVRSLNKVMLIGNLTRDPELRYTPAGTAVCSIGLATNRYWTTEAGEKREESEFHKIVAWNKLAELCSQLLTKGRKVYVEGRLQTRSWQGQDGNQRSSTEVVIEDMIILDPRRDGMGAPVGVSMQQPQAQPAPAATVQPAPVSGPVSAQVQPSDAATPATEAAPTEVSKEDINPDDIPF